MCFGRGGGKVERMKKIWTWLAAVAAAGTAWGWAGMQHLQITQEAGKCAPAEMAHAAAFAKAMAFPAVCPDLWKQYDEQEGPRHFFEIDRLRGKVEPGEVSPDRSVAFGKQFRLKRDELGVAPWKIAELFGMMRDAMRTNDWEWAARCGATMAHYAGDLHQPLHCVRNFNGQETRQHGVHTRIESQMVKAFFKPVMVVPEEGRYLEDPFRAAVEWAGQSAAMAPRWLRADLEATREAGGEVESEDYYVALWERLEPDVLARISAAVTDVASLFYTAWVDAGKPEIPATWPEVSRNSVWSGVGIDDPGAGTGPKAQNRRKYDYLIWAFLGGMFFWALVQSVWVALKDNRRLKGIRKK